MSLARVLSKIANLVTITGSNLAVAGEISGPKGVARAWVVFDGTRDTSGNVSTSNTNRQIIASYNVSAVSRTAAGTHVVTIGAGVMGDANFAVTYGSQGQAYASRDAAHTTTATAFGVTTRSISTPGTPIDVSRVDLAFFD